MKETSSPRTTRLVLLLTALALATSTVTSARGLESTYPVQVDSGWNLLSLPGSVVDGRTANLFPSAISPAYIFQYPAGYVVQDTLQNGTGFWLKFASSEIVPFQGYAVFSDTVEVQAGWNIIGSLSVPVAVGSIATEPPGIITSQFFGYLPGGGYRSDTTLYPGLGYWVKVSQSGSIVLSSATGLPCLGIPTVFYAGKTYNTVQIGSQCWLRENLDVGTMVLGSQNQTANDTIEKYCYDNNPAKCDTFGGLYQWNEAMQYDTIQGGRGICPPGWHIPTLAQFDTLYTTVCGDGNALKAIGQGSGWGAGTNTSGFCALLAGYHNSDGNFGGLGDRVFVWSSTQAGSALAGLMDLNNSSIDIYFYPSSKYHGLSVRCLKDEAPNQPPAVPSNPYPDSGATNITTSPTLRWSGLDPDADPLTYDVYFGTVNPPDSLVSSNQMDTTLTTPGLAPGTRYYWGVVAKDDHAHSTAGPVWNFMTYTGGGSPCPGVPTVLYDGRVYNTVLIGSQCWLRENLAVGTMVPGSQDQINNGIIEKYCYNDSAANCHAYGGLYQWNEIMQYDTTQGVRGVCPPGWHIPTVWEYQTLHTTVGGDGNALKAIGQGTGGGSGTNSSGFSALLAGNRYSYGGPPGFQDIGENTIVLSSTQVDPTFARVLYLNSTNGYLDISMDYRWYGFSVRCIKN